MIRSLFAAVFASYACVGHAADWFYDPGAGTITDGVWTFNVTTDSSEMILGAHKANPAVVSELDLSKPIKDSSENSYMLVTLNPQFNNDAAGKLIGRLILPPSGVTEISANAFNNCTALTNIVNYLPDSVTKVCNSAFYKCPAKQELRVIGVTYFGTQGGWGAGTSVDHFSNLAFNSSGITRIVFGPGLKEINDWDNGPFSGCQNLTNVTFDASMSGARFSGCRCGGFYNCKALTGTIDLSGFSDLTYLGTAGGDGRILGNTAITKVILGSGLTKLHVNFFDQMSKLREVTFNSAPGSGGFTFYTEDSSKKANGFMFGGLPAYQGVIARVREQDVAAWSSYAKDGVISNIDSTFSEAFAGPNYAVRYLMTAGGTEPIGPVGDWVYDDAAGVLSNRLWAFQAEGIASSLQRVGPCVRYPDSLSLLDFTTSVTDTRGLPMKILLIDTQFSTASDNAKMSTAGSKVGELRLPNGLVAIQAAAFSRLDNCTNVVNFLPDSVKEVYNYAFYKLPAVQPLSLKGVAKLGVNGDNAVYTFGSSKITSVTFGPDFKVMKSWSKSPFGGCTSLTNVVFDPAITGAEFDGIRMDGFYGCSGLKGTVELTGFSNLSYVSDYGGNANIFTGTKVEHFIVGADCTKLGAGFFDGVTTLKDVTFMGPPPEIKMEVLKTGGWHTQKDCRFFGYDQASIKITTCIHKADREAWLPYTTATSVDQLKKKCGITWKAEYVSDDIDLSLRPFSVVDDISGLVIVVR